MAATFTFIQRIDTTASSITFSSIPSTYQDLIILGNAKSGQGLTYDDLQIRFNGSSASYKSQNIYGYDSTFTYQSDGTTTSGTMYATRGIPGSAASMSGSYGQIWIYIPSYVSSSVNRVAFWRTGYANTAASTFNGGASIGAGISYGVGTTAINSISIFLNSGYSFTSGTNFILYGIKNS